MTIPLRNPRFLILVGLFIASIALSVRFAFNYYSFSQKLQTDLEQTITLANKTVTQDFAHQLDATIKQLVAQFSEQVHVGPDMANQAKQFLTNQQVLAGLILIPTSTTRAIQLIKKNDAATQVQPELIAITSNTWSNPSFSAALQQWVVSYWFTPKNAQEQIGFIVPLSFLKNMLTTALADATSYATLIDTNGTVIVHQFDQYIPMKNTIFEQLNSENEATEKIIAHNLKKNTAGLITYKDRSIGQTVWLATMPVANSSWLVATIAYPYNFVQQSTDQLRQHIIMMSVSLLITLCLFFLVIGYAFNSFFAWWMTVFFVSLACMAELGFLWYVGFTHAREKHVDYKMVVDSTQLQSFINVLKQQNVQTSKPFITLATGLFLENVEFTREANELLPIALITGYIWQRYTKGVHDSLQRAFLLPDAFNVQTQQIAKIVDGADERICWQFSCKIYEAVTLLTYPFDHRHLNLRIMHPQQLSENILLIPDFGAYELMNPSLLPGLARSIKIPHWNIYSSFFDYRFLNYKTTFGLRHILSAQPVAQLNFSFICQRQLVGEFVTYLILIVMSLIILFILLLSFSKNELYTNLIGFTNLNILTVLSGLLFVLILSHISLRQTTDIIGISYMESFYFICYLFITAMAINSTLFIFNRGGHFIQYEHNLIPKLIYWPLFLLFTITATVIAFY